MNKPFDAQKAMIMLLENFPSARAAAMATGISASHISRIVRGKDVPAEMRWDQKEKLLAHLTASQLQELSGTEVQLESRTARLVTWIESLPGSQQEAFMTIAKAMGFNG